MGAGLTIDGSQDDSGVVVGDDVGVTIFGLVHLQVGVFPGELLARVDRLMTAPRPENKRREQTRERGRKGEIISELYRR